MNGESLNIEKDNLARLMQDFPQLFTEGKLDWEKLKATFSDDINFANERYVLRALIALAVQIQLVWQAPSGRRLLSF